MELMLGTDVNSMYLKQGIGRVAISEFEDEQEVVYYPKRLRVPTAHFTFQTAGNAREIYERIVQPYYNILVSAYDERPLRIERRARGEFLNHDLLLPSPEAYF